MEKEFTLARLNGTTREKMPRNEHTKADYQPWNHEHFMADPRVRRLTSSARKSYVMLLHEAFFCSTRPYLPDNDAELELLADCDSPEEWNAMKEDIRSFFIPVKIDGVNVLVQKRVEEDWNRILSKRGGVSEARRKAAYARWCKPMQTDANASENTEEEENHSFQEDNANRCKPMQTMLREVKRSKEKHEKSKDLQHDFLETEGTDMKSEKLISMICRKILKTYPDLSEDNKFHLRTLDAEYKGSVVAKTFEAWAKEHRHDGLRKPIARFLEESLDLFGDESSLESESSENQIIKQFSREVALYTHNDIVFKAFQKEQLADILSEGDYSFEQLMAVFVDFFQKLDDRSRPYAAKDFVETVSDRLYAAEKNKAKAEAETALIASASSQLTSAASEAVQRVLEAKAAEDEPMEMPE
jgi:hypothetical protein